MWNTENIESPKQHSRSRHSDPSVQDALSEYEEKIKSSAAKKDGPKEKVSSVPNFNEMIRRRHPMANPMVQKTTGML